MLSEFWRQFVRWRRIHSRPRPLVSHHHDLKHVRLVRGKRFPEWRQFFHMSELMSAGERLLFRAVGFVFVCSFFWLVIVFAGHFRNQVSAVGGSYTEAVVGTPQLINPIFSPANEVDTDIVSLVYSGLMRYDKKQRLIPDIASGFEVSTDRLTYTFHLRTDVRFHDGEPLTAHDVVFTIETIQNPTIGSPLFVTFQGIQAEAIDDSTVVFHLKEPFAPFLSTLTVGILPEHVWFDVPAERFRLTQKNIQPTGTGPFAFKKLTKDDRGVILEYQLKRFADFYRSTPFIEDFAFRFYSDYEGDQGPIQDVREGHVDGLSFVPRALRDRIARKQIILHTLQLPEYTALFFNQDRKSFLKDVAVRRALAEALDKDRIVRESTDDEGARIESPILPGFPGYDETIEKISYSPSKANEQLDLSFPRISAEAYRTEREASLIAEQKKIQENEITSSTEPVSDTVTTTLSEQALLDIQTQLDKEIRDTQTFFRKNKEGEILSLTIVTSNAPEQKHAAELVAGFWQEIGIRVDVKFVDPIDLSRVILKKRDYDILLYGVIVGNDPDQYPFWHSSQIDYPGLNLSRYANKDVDALLLKVRESTDEVVRTETYRSIQTQILKDIPAIFLYSPTYTYATASRVQGIDVNKISQPSDRFANVVEWYIKTKGVWKF